MDDHQNSELACTGAFKTNNRFGLTIISSNLTTFYKLPLHFSIFRAGSLSVHKSIEHFHNNTEYLQTNYIILSSSGLNCINYTQNPTDVTKNCQEETYRAAKKGKQIHFIWMSGLIGIPGNEKANQEAVQATIKTTTPMLNICSYSDAKNVTNCHIINKWQVYWRNLNTKLNTIKTHINP